MQIKVKHFVYCLMTSLAFVLCAFVSALLLQPTDRVSFALYMLHILVSIVCICLYKAFRNGKVVFFIGFLVLGSLFALRAQTGTDDVSYEYLFFRIGRVSFLKSFSVTGVEPGYIVLNRVLYKLTRGSYNAAQFIISELTFCVWASGFWKWRKRINIKFALFMFFTNYYFFFMGIALVRMFLAVAIVFSGFDELPKRHAAKYTAYVLVASLFHRSALFMLILLPLAWKSWNAYKQWKLYVTFSLCVIPLIFLFIARFIAPYLASMSVRYDGYDAVGSLSSFSVFDLDTLPFLIAAIFLLKRISRENRDDMIFIIILLGISTGTKISASLAKFARLNWYVNVSLILFASIVAQERKIAKFYKYSLSVLMIIYGFLYMMHAAFLNEVLSDNLLPYLSFLSAS